MLALSAVQRGFFTNVSHVGNFKDNSAPSGVILTGGYMSEFREMQPRHIILVTPSDTEQFYPLNGLRVANETAGWLNLKVRNMNSNPNGNNADVVLRIPPASVCYEPGQFSRVWSTGSDGANLTIHGYADRLPG